MVRIARMALSKAGLELGAVAALAAVMLGGFYYQGTRVDAAEERLGTRISNESARLDERIDGVNERIDSLNERLNKRIDDLGERLDGRIDGLDRRLARIEGLLEALASTQSPSEESDGALG